MMRIAILDDYQKAALRSADWQSLHPGVQVEALPEHISDQDTLAKRLQAFDGVVLMRERTPFPRELIERLPQLRLIVTAGMRNASLDVETATRRGIQVCGTEMLGYPTAELAWGLILALFRHIPEENAAIRQGRWQLPTLGNGLKGKTLGILGLGRLGGQVAGFGKAFDMEVVAWSQNLTEARAAEHAARRVSKDQLFAASDVVTVHLVLGDRSRGLVGAAEFARMKSTAYFVNTSRGPIVQEAALIDVLRTRRIAGAALDVFDREPLPRDHPLLALGNVILTPHLGYATEEAYRQVYQQALEAIRGFLDGKPVRPLNRTG